MGGAELTRQPVALFGADTCQGLCNRKCRRALHDILARDLAPALESPQIEHVVDDLERHANLLCIGA